VRVKGSALKARVTYVQERGGDEVYARFVSQLAPGTRALVEGGMLATEWYPFECFMNLCETADALLGAGDLESCFEMGRYACELNLTTLYKLLFRVGSVGFILKRARVAWRTTYDSGELRVVEDTPGFVRMQIEEWPQPRRAHCLSILGWMHRAVELSGGKVLGSEEKCRARGEAVCEFAIRFQE
jgi:hypothetical protein